MVKDFDTWNELKKVVDEKEIEPNLFFRERQVWWCSLGLNIGIESDGKHELFKRPVLILKVFNSYMIWVVPLTSKIKSTEFYRKIVYESGTSWACITQIRTISTKRLLRRVGVVNEADFEEVLSGIRSYITIGPHIAVRSSEPEGTNTSSINDSKLASS